MPFVFPVINLTNGTGWHDERSLLHEYEEMSLNLADAGQDQLVFFDDFDDMNYDNWTVDSGTWDASEGYLASKGRSFHNPENSSEIIYEPAEIRRDLGENVSFNNMSLAFDFAFANSLYNENGTQDIQIRFWINESSLFTFNIVNIGNPVKDSFFSIRKIINGSDMLLYDLNFFPSDYCFHSVNITIIDNRITLIYDDTITFYKIMVPEFEEWTFSNFSIKLEGLDDTGCSRYRKFDNIKLMRISGINNEPQPISTSKFTKQTIISDDFSDGNYDGWIVDSGTWGASEGYIRSKGCYYLGNLGTTFMDFPAEIRHPLSTLIPFNNMSLKFDFRFENIFYYDDENYEDLGRVNNTPMMYTKSFPQKDIISEINRRKNF